MLVLTPRDGCSGTLLSPVLSLSEDRDVELPLAKDPRNPERGGFGEHSGWRGFHLLSVIMSSIGTGAEALDPGDDGAAKWAGFLATGGAAFCLMVCSDDTDIERTGSGGVAAVCVGPAPAVAAVLASFLVTGEVVMPGPDVDPRAPMPVCLRGGGGGGGVSDLPFFPSSLSCNRPTFAGRFDGSNGGGRGLLGAEFDAEVESSIEWLTCSNGDVERLEKEESLDSDLGILTQSGSSVGM